MLFVDVDYVMWCVLYVVCVVKVKNCDVGWLMYWCVGKGSEFVNGVGEVMVCGGKGSLKMMWL